MSSFIYLDNNATTSIDDEVTKAMLPYFAKPLNPSSVHPLGQEAKRLVERSKQTLASHLGVKAQEIYFTSGATESLNWLIRSLAPKKGVILSTMIEHPCIYETLLDLKKEGASIQYVPVGQEGAPKIETIKASLESGISLMVFSAVYTETGAVLNVKELAHLAATYHIPLIIDGVGLLGKERFSIPQGVSGMAFSAHKLHGPRGVGAAFISSKVKCSSLLKGGYQERGLRAGTENVEGIIGFEKAIALLDNLLPMATKQMQEMRDYFEALLLSSGINLKIQAIEKRICNTSCLYFPNIDAETLLLCLFREGVYASMGSACASGSLEPSRVLLNMGLSREEAKSSLRFSFSRKTTKEEVEKAVSIILKCIKTLS